MKERVSNNLASESLHRLLFYNDAPVYGGHEVMLLNGLEYLVQTGMYQIVFIYSPTNMRLEAELTKLKCTHPSISLIPFHYTSERLQFLRTLCSLRPLQKLRTLVRSYRPDCVVVVQGEISLSSLGVLSGVLEGIYTISYIPMAHSRRQRGDSSFPRLKDAILWWYYQFPQHFITISHSMASMLRLRGAKQPIEVVENGIDISALKTVNKAQAKAHLDLGQFGFVAALVGRIEFKQKGHDVLLQALAHKKAMFNSWVFLVIGDGPDKHSLEVMIKDLGLGHKVRLLPWQDNLSLVYSAIDMLLLPSRFEGVPVTMLEAMYCRLPIVSSNIPPITEFLPKEWLFPVGDSRALVDTMLRVRSVDNRQLLEDNRQLISARFTQERQKEEFGRVLSRCMVSVSETNMK